MIMQTGSKLIKVDNDDVLVCDTAYECTVKNMSDAINLSAAIKQHCVESALYKLPSGAYTLLIIINQLKLRECKQIMYTLSEFGIVRNNNTNTARVGYFIEHCELIIPEYAIHKLAMLGV